MDRGASELPRRLARRSRVGGLLDEAQAGSPEALGQLFDAVRAYLLLAANRNLPRRIRGKVGPSDIVQEAMLAAHCGFESFRGGSPAEFFGWIRGILRHRVADSVRRYDTSGARSVRRELPFAEVASRDEPSLVSASASPESAAIRGEDALALEETLRRLPVDQRTVIWMRHWEGKSFAEIAAACEKTEPAVRKIWGRGFKRLKCLLESHATFASGDPPRPR